MAVAEKIKISRKMHGFSQKMPEELAGDINEATVRLLKITNALDINIFMDFDIETMSDVLSLIFKMDEPLDIEFTSKKNKNREYASDSISLKLNNPVINDHLAK